MSGGGWMVGWIGFVAFLRLMGRNGAEFLG